MEPDEDFRCFVLDCQREVVVEMELLTDVEQRSGSNPCAQGHIGFRFVSTDRYTT